MVVPVLVAFGSGTPLAWRAALREWLLKSNPVMASGDMYWSGVVDEGGSWMDGWLMEWMELVWGGLERGC